MGSFCSLFLLSLVIFASFFAGRSNAAQHVLSRGPSNRTWVAQDLFWELEQLARIVDISYCVGTAGLGIQKPFQCLSRCADRDFDTFELLTVSHCTVRVETDRVLTVVGMEHRPFSL